MTRLLRIDASSRGEGSQSRALADAFVESWLEQNPGGEVVVRDLAADPIPHIAEQTIAGFYTSAHQLTPALRKATALSDALIAELKGADEIVIATPMYNFSVPSALKAWIDQIVRIGETFSYDGSAFAGLVTGKKATLITAYGAGGYQPGEAFAAADFLVPYLTFLFGFLGFESVTNIPLEATNSNPETVAANRSVALDTIAHSVAASA
jgi:FMN-dependent NADH-azoreductase